MTDEKKACGDAKICPRCGGQGYVVTPFGGPTGCGHPECKAKKR